VVLACAHPGPDHAEPGGMVQGQAGGVLREDAGLDRPDPGRLSRGDQRAEEPTADAPAPGGGVDVDGVLDHPGVDAAAGYGRGGYPPGDLAFSDRDVPVGGQPGRGEGRPVRRAGLEGGVALLDPGLVDRQDRGGVRAGHRLGPHARGREGHGYGLAARMIAECRPSPACWAGVMVMPVNPARVRPSRYSVTEGAPAMHPARAPHWSRSAGVRWSSARMSVMPRRPPGRSTRKLSAKTAGRSVDRLITQLEMITSTELSGSGIASIWPWRNSTFCAPSARALARARSSISVVMSRPYALPTGPTRRADSSTSMPPPH